MVNTFYRWVFVFLGLAPLSVGLFSAGASDWESVLSGVGIGTALCILACLAFKAWIRAVSNAPEKTPLIFVSITKRRESASAYFLAYVLPLLVGGSVSQYVLWGLIPLFALVCFFTEAESNNPVARLMGYKFYEVTTPGGNSFLVMSKCDMQSLRGGVVDKHSRITGILFDDNFFIHEEAK